jgi:hypothetical protein
VPQISELKKRLPVNTESGGFIGTILSPACELGLSHWRVVSRDGRRLRVQYYIDRRRTDTANSATTNRGIDPMPLFFLR